MMRFKSTLFHTAKPKAAAITRTAPVRKPIELASRLDAVRKPVELVNRLQANRTNIQRVEAKQAPLSSKVIPDPYEVPAKLFIAPQADGRFTVKIAWTGKNGPEERLIAGLDPQYIAQTIAIPAQKDLNVMSSADLDGRGRQTYWKIQNGQAERFTAKA